MKLWIRRHRKLFLSLLFFLLILSIIVAIGIGPVYIPPKQVWNIIWNNFSFTSNDDSVTTYDRIIWQLRVPRVLLGFVVGGGLAVAGVGMQAFTRNPLAGPYVLGISSGASAGAVMAMVTSVSFITVSTGAFIGAIVTILLVYSLSGGTRGEVVPVKLVLTGMAVSAMFSSFTSFLIYTAKTDNSVRNVTFWMMGGLSGAKWSYIYMPFIIFVITLLIFLSLSNSLNAMLMGDQTAITLGVNIRFVRVTVIVFTALLTSAIIAVSGSISFVGLVVPHIVRNIVGNDHKAVVLGSALIGGIFLIWADVMARTVAGTSELPIGILTGLTGAPFFIFLLKKSRYSFGD